MPQDDMVPVNTVNERFDRIEKKIDKLSDVMITLARTEERMNSLEVSHTSIIERVDRHADKIDRLNSDTKDNTRVIANITKLTWILVTGVGGLLIKMFVII